MRVRLRPRPEEAPPPPPTAASGGEPSLHRGTRPGLDAARPYKPVGTECHLPRTGNLISSACGWHQGAKARAGEAAAVGSVR